MLREYLTKLSVKIDMDNTSNDLEIEYINGIKEWLFFNNGMDNNLDKQSTSRQHRFSPWPPTGWILCAVSPK